MRGIHTRERWIAFVNRSSFLTFAFALLVINLVNVKQNGPPISDEIGGPFFGRLGVFN
jgi:hypothetical protein